MTSIFESVSNQLSSLPHLIPSFVRKPNENDERIDDLENQIARLDRESNGAMSNSTAESKSSLPRSTH